MLGIEFENLFPFEKFWQIESNTEINSAKHCLIKILFSIRGADN